MSDFKTTPIKNSYELMIDRLKAVISDKDAELARLKAEVESLKWWQGHGQKLRNAIFTHLMDLPGKSVFEVPTSDDDVEAQPKAIFAMCGKLGIKDDFEVHKKASRLAGIPGDEVVTSLKDLTKGQASSVIDTLNKELDK